MASGEHYLGHSQGVDSTAVTQSDVVSNGGYGAKPKTTGPPMEYVPTQDRPMVCRLVLEFPSGIPAPPRQGLRSP